MLLNMRVTSVLFLVQLNNFALTMGFYWSYTLLLSCPFLCTLGHLSNCIPVGHSLYTQFTGPIPLFCESGLVWLVWLGYALQASRFFIGFGMAFCVSTFFPPDVTWHHHTWRDPPGRSYTSVFAIKYWRQWKFGNEAKFRGIMGQYVNLVHSNYQALWVKGVKQLIGKLSAEPCLSYD